MSHGLNRPNDETTRTRRVAGITLTETMLAAALGVLTVIILAQAMLLALRHARQDTQRHVAHQTLLEAEQLLRGGVITGGRVPCPRGKRSWYAVNNADAHYWAQLFRGTAEVLAHDDTLANTVQPIGTNAGARVAGNDIILLRRVGTPIAVTRHDTDSHAFVLNDTASFKRGDLGVVCDARTIALFQVTRVSNRGLRVTYRPDSTVRPGNCGGVFSDGNGCSGAPYVFDGAVVMPYYATAFYIGNGHHPGSFSLFRKNLTRRSYRDGSILSYMLGGEVLTGVRSLRAAVITEHNNLIKHQYAPTSDDNILGLMIELSVGGSTSPTPPASPVSHPSFSRDIILHHAFHVVL